jgi:RHS repeat-associated protein
MSAGNSGNLIKAANERAQSLQDQRQSVAAGGNSHMGREADVVSDALKDLIDGGKNLPATARDAQSAYLTGLVSAIGPDTNYGTAFVAEAQSSFQQAMDLAANNWKTVTEADGLLAKAGAGMTILTGMEQMLSGPFSLIKFPAMPAVRVLDFALGLPHGHMHPPTNGFPLPSIGPVIPLPWGLSGAENVTINGRAAARCGDMGIGVWCGGYFPIYEILLGSSSVWIEGARAARQGVDLTFHCMMSRLPGKDSPTTGIPLGFLITASDNVIIGGFPLPSLLSLLLGGVFNLLGRGVGKLVGLARRAARRAGREAAEEAGKAAKKAPRKPNGSHVDQGRTVKCNDPVDIASGRVFASQTVFELAGPMPIEFSHVYDTSAVNYEGPLGCGWIHTYDIHLWLDEGQEMVILRNEEALPLGFNLVDVGEMDFNPLEKLWLERLDDKVYVVRGPDGVRYKFASIKTQVSEVDGTSEATALRLIEIEDRNLNRIDLSYEEGRLKLVKDGAGTQLNLSYINLANGVDRLIEVSLSLEKRSARTAKLVNFTYDAEGRLIGSTEHGQVPWRYAYDGHLLTRRTNRNGFSFHFAYRGKGKDSRCVHTWGDGGTYERWLDYDTEERKTIVENSLGAKTTFYFNEFDLPVRVVDALGMESQYRYSSKGELLSVTDEIGRTTRYKYNAQGDCTSVTHPDGAVRRFTYAGDSLLQKVIDEAGAEFHREYDQHGYLIRTTDALGNRREYSYNEDGYLDMVVDPLGGETKFKWNELGQIIEYITPLGSITRFGYDEHGNLVWISNPLGQMTRYAYDSLGNLVQVESPDGMKSRYQYDHAGNLTNFMDPNGVVMRYRYVDHNLLGEQIDALEYKQQFKYNTEGDLVEIRNERNESYMFTYDMVGRLTREVGFDGLTKEYKYDSAGQLITYTDPAGRVTRFVYDICGNLVMRQRRDGTTISYGYDSVGRLTRAEAPNSTLIFKYDPLGRVIWESQNGMVLEHEYDALGRRIKRVSVTGHVIEFGYDLDNLLQRLQTPHGSIEFEYDKVGRIANYRIPGDLAESFYYDSCGQLVEQALHKPTKMLFHRGFKYDNVGKLIELNDSNKGTSRFSYDPVERLSEVVLPGRGGERLNYDSTGNLLRRGSRQFRYEPGDRLATINDSTLTYDEVGNIIEERHADSLIRYSYDADDQLIAVESEDGRRIEFVYDAFGRRISKKSKTDVIRFLWDGDVLLAEEHADWSREYIFNSGSHIPLCRFDDSHFEAYHNNHLGAPCEITDENGEIVWSANYDIYGSILDLRVSAMDNPIRFQGQYEDRETGLFYNRFRYYHPELGRYISQDPIGISGGLNSYSYTPNPVNWVDPLGLAFLNILGDPWVIFHKGMTPTMKKKVRGNINNLIGDLFEEGEVERIDRAGHHLVFRPQGPHGFDHVSVAPNWDVFIHETKFSKRAPTSKYTAINKRNLRTNFQMVVNYLNDQAKIRPLTGPESRVRFVFKRYLKTGSIGNLKIRVVTPELPGKRKQAKIRGITDGIPVEFDDFDCHG